MLWRFLEWDIRAESAEAFLLAAWSRARSPSKDCRGYMEEVAERAYLAEGNFIRTNNVNNFVEDLKHHKYLDIVCLQ